ncbi:MAG: DNA repair protein RadA [Alistipes sp.]|jgi:DNA repair protein RadA/Sms|nr:DNA repair protein RadA [Alistipes sp.]
MAKIKKAYFCSSCGNEQAKWMGRCPACGEWNTFVEEIVAKEETQGARSLVKTQATAKPVPVREIVRDELRRIDLGIGEVNRVLGGTQGSSGRVGSGLGLGSGSTGAKSGDGENREGGGNKNASSGGSGQTSSGGMVPGSFILLGGEPGIGKSTLSLQIALGSHGLRTLYVSGEESPSQIKMRADRISAAGSEECYVYAETLLENIVAQADALEPGLIIIDSIQTIYTDIIDSSPGSMSQIRECAATLLKYAKTHDTSIIIIGHITKDGAIAGPKVLEHIVDVVLSFEGDGAGVYRILRGIKNRFGATFEIGVFEMRAEGLVEVANPSEILLGDYEEPLSGIAVGAAVDGIRPYLIETQALVSGATYGTPQRSATGYDMKRMNMLLAVLEKRAGLKLGAKDVFLNFAGGFRIADTGLDLAVAGAVMSSYFDREIAQGVVLAGEIGLSGEVRPAPRSEQRIAEAARLGFRRIVVSGYLRKNFSSDGGGRDDIGANGGSGGNGLVGKNGGAPHLPKGIEICYVNRIDELGKYLFAQ